MRLSGEELRKYAEKVRSIEEQLFECVWRYSGFWERLIDYLASRSYRYCEYYVTADLRKRRDLLTQVRAVLNEYNIPVLPDRSDLKSTFERLRPKRLSYIKFAQDFATYCRKIVSVLDTYNQEVVTPIVEGHTGLVYAEVKKIQTRSIHVSFPHDDLVQAGMLGLLQAIHRFSFDRGTQFSTFAVHWIRAEIGCCVDSFLFHAKVSDEQKTKVLRYYNTKEMSDEYDSLTSEVSRFWNTASVLNTVSLSDCYFDDDSCSVASTIPDPASNAGEAFLSAAMAWEHFIEKARELLTDVEWMVLRHRFGLLGSKVLTLKEIGCMIGRSDEYVRCIEKQALLKIKSSPELLDTLSEIYLESDALV